MEDVVPALLLRLKVPLKGHPLSSSDSHPDSGSLSGAPDDLALLGLQGLVSTRARDLLEYLVDPSLHSGQAQGYGQGKASGRLMTHPMSAAAARALAGVLEVCTGSQTLNHFFSSLVPALCLEMVTASDVIDTLTASSSSGGGEVGSESELLYEQDRLDAVKQAAVALMTAVSSPGSIGFLVSELSKLMEHETDVRRRRWGCYLTEQLFRCSRAPYSDLVPVLLKNLLSRVAETDKPLLQAVSDALSALSTANTVVSLDELATHLTFMQSCIGSAASDARHRAGNKDSLYSKESGEFHLPLLSLPKALEPFLAICLHALMNGSHQQRETSADVISELALWTDPSLLKPYLIKTTGPLIRVVGDRFPSAVKAAILTTLTTLLDRGGAGLKAFVPQLQVTPPLSRTCLTPLLIRTIIQMTPYLR